MQALYDFANATATNPLPKIKYGILLPYLLFDSFTNVLAY